MLSFVSTEEVVALFNIYYEKMNFLCNLLDPTFHTPSLVCSRSPFLLTTICAVASRFYFERPELHAKLSELSRKLAFSVPEKGYKSVEIVQAYLLSTLWGCGPVERYEQDRTWFLLGMAISAQMGKPYTIKEDFIVRNASQWCQSPVATQGDVALAAYADLQRILTRSLDLLYSGTNTASGLQLDSDYLLVITTMETQIVAWQHEWSNIRNVGQGQLITDTLICSPFAYPHAGEPDFVLKNRLLMGKFYFNYAMLIVNSFGLQNALERSAVDIGHFFARCHSSASACALLIRDELAPLGYLRYSPDSNFVMGSYAVLSLMKLLRPEFQTFLDHEQKTITLVKDVAEAFESVAIGPSHTPALYSAFLRALLSAKMDPASDSTRPQSSSGQNKSPTTQGNTRPPNSNGSSSRGSMPPPSIIPNNNGTMANSLNNGNPENMPNEFQFDSEMGPAADISTFPPIMAPQSQDNMNGMMSMDAILSTEFWDSVLVPGEYILAVAFCSSKKLTDGRACIVTGYSNTFEGLSGGFVYGAGGSGLITPGFNITPYASGSNTPTRHLRNLGEITQNGLDAAFNGSHSVSTDGVSVNS
ncbi:hypothetical protein EUX98_g3075 [Antrodiella citrinella]|uniref:Transcription factor domain-containing protein n=1 Tax=Antrodiella citrinella TaxID=2447956 RepID=A0A4V3XIZ6_9APHY|nr:hypothetical protein EUX98_g3075 [Antrodiella citrinella]